MKIQAVTWVVWWRREFVGIGEFAMGESKNSSVTVLPKSPKILPCEVAFAILEFGGRKANSHLYNLMGIWDCPKSLSTLLGFS